MRCRFCRNVTFKENLFSVFGLFKSVYNIHISFFVQGKKPAQYKIDKEQRTSGSICLDPNHTHFVLVDNGTQHKFCVEIPFRAKLEKKITKMKTNTGESM